MEGKAMEGSGREKLISRMDATGKDFRKRKENASLKVGAGRANLGRGGEREKVRWFESRGIRRRGGLRREKRRCYCRTGGKSSVRGAIGESERHRGNERTSCG